jgi:hypothetical protein
MARRPGASSPIEPDGFRPFACDGRRWSSLVARGTRSTAWRRPDLGHLALVGVDRPSRGFEPHTPTALIGRSHQIALAADLREGCRRQTSIAGGWCEAPAVGVPYGDRVEVEGAAAPARVLPRPLASRHRLTANHSGRACSSAAMHDFLAPARYDAVRFCLPIAVTGGQRPFSHTACRFRDCNVRSSARVRTTAGTRATGHPKPDRSTGRVMAGSIVDREGSSCPGAGGNVDGAGIHSVMPGSGGRLAFDERLTAAKGFPDRGGEDSVGREARHPSGALGGDNP